MSEQEELKPCPWCAKSEAELVWSTPDREGIPVFLRCIHCGASGPWLYAADEYEGKFAAVREWNTRAPIKDAK